jgi:photosystem I reaction center subunit V
LQHRIHRFATPASFLLKSNDPEGFNVIDVLAWGALGHALGYFILVRSMSLSPHVAARDKRMYARPSSFR